MCPQDRITNRLTAEFVRTVTADKQRRFSDGRRANGLALSVRPASPKLGLPCAKSWVQTIRVNGRETRIGIGAYPEVSLTIARQRAAANVHAMRAGEALPYGLRSTRSRPDVRRAAKSVTFALAIEETIAVKRPGWTGKRVESQWRGALTRYATPTLGDRQVSDIDQQDVLAILSPLRESKPSTSKHLRQYMRDVFKWAMSAGFCDTNPAGEILDGALPKRTAKKEHRAAVAYSAVPAVLATVRGMGTSAALALELATLTALRTCEASGAQWSEFDFESKTWTIPASRMKRRIAHTVPLSDAALDCLRRIREHNALPLNAIKYGTVTATHLFHGRVADSKLGAGALLATLRETGAKDTHGKPATVHGMRRSFRTWAAESGKDRLLGELCLAHDTRGEIERIYSETELTELRRDVMQAWGEHCTA